MAMMTARFSCEGIQRELGTIESGGAPLISVSVRLKTNGQYVTFDWDDGRPPALTPKGWAEFAIHAAELVNRANEAWASMGAEK